MNDDVIFSVSSVLGGTVTLTGATWDDICRRKHRDMSGRLAEVQMTVERPDEIRRSRSNQLVYLYYRVEAARRFVCVVTRSSGSGHSTIATAYTTTRVKPGDLVWPT